VEDAVFSACGARDGDLVPGVPPLAREGFTQGLDIDLLRRHAQLAKVITGALVIFERCGRGVAGEFAGSRLGAEMLTWHNIDTQVSVGKG
jgi:hypothetical protein